MSRTCTLGMTARHSTLFTLASGQSGLGFYTTQRDAAVDHGEWRPTAEPERPGYVGFHIWAGYSFSPNASWEQLVREFLEVKSDPEMLQTFVNTVLGETFEESYHRELEASDLMKRRESFEDGVCPDGVLLLTMGVDVQDDRLAFGVYGWSEGEHCWRISSGEIDGNPTRDEPWEQLLTIIDHEWPTAGGKALKIAQVAVDSGGHCTSEVYGFARENRQRGVMGAAGGRRGAVADQGWVQPVEWGAAGFGALRA